uniref:BZIP domain-containing protein n=1 Tax=Kalanchoe fedtschenkoi TaxID=63787 RepID=A0A7N0TRP3_KALFE
MISNRESARRSRMRKQKHLDELWSQVTRLRTENHALLDKFNHVFESHSQVVQENVKLKDEVSQLRKMIADLQITSPETFLRELREMPCITDNAREASLKSNHSISSSIDLLD